MGLEDLFSQMENEPVPGGCPMCDAYQTVETLGPGLYVPTDVNLSSGQKSIPRAPCRICIRLGIFAFGATRSLQVASVIMVGGAWACRNHRSRYWAIRWFVVTLDSIVPDQPGWVPGRYPPILVKTKGISVPSLFFLLFNTHLSGTTSTAI